MNLTIKTFHTFDRKIRRGFKSFNRACDFKQIF